jgi:hypothetical protein
LYWWTGVAETVAAETKGEHMLAPPIVSAQEWEASYQQMLVKEKEFSRARCAGRNASSDALDTGDEAV